MLLTGGSGVLVIVGCRAEFVGVDVEGAEEVDGDVLGVAVAPAFGLCGVPLAVGGI